MATPVDPSGSTSSITPAAPTSGDSIPKTTAVRPQSEQERRACTNPLGTVCERARQERVTKERQTQERRKQIVQQALKNAGVTTDQLADSSNLTTWVSNSIAYLRSLQPLVESPGISAAQMGQDAQRTLVSSIAQESRNDRLLASFAGTLIGLVNRAPAFESHISKVLRNMDTSSPQGVGRSAAVLVDFFTTCSPDGMGLNARSDGAVCPYYLNNAVTNEQRRRVALHEIGHAIDTRGGRAPLYSRYLACQGVRSDLGIEAAADYWSFVGMASDLRGASFDRVLQYAQNAFSHYCAPLTRVLSGVAQVVQREFDRVRDDPDSHPETEDRIRHFANEANIATLFNCRGGAGRGSACRLGGPVQVNGTEAFLTQTR